MERTSCLPLTAQIPLLSWPSLFFRWEPSRLVDHATVTIENIHRHAGRKPLHEAMLEGAAQIAAPTLVSTLTICIVFVSLVFPTGPGNIYSLQ